MYDRMDEGNAPLRTGVVAAYVILTIVPLHRPCRNVNTSFSSPKVKAVSLAHHGDNRAIRNIPHVPQQIQVVIANRKISHAGLINDIDWVLRSCLWGF